MSIIKNIKALVCLCTILIVSSVSLFAQQTITKFAVVDTARVYQAFYNNSKTVRDYEDKKKEAEAEIEKVTKELQTLHNRKLAADRSGDRESSQNLQMQITQKANYLSEYTATKNAELESLKRSMQNNDTFYKKLMDVLKSVAEGEGYSMVLSLTNDNSILWYSDTVDITDKVIKQLGLTVK